MNEHYTVTDALLDDPKDRSDWLADLVEYAEEDAEADDPCAETDLGDY